MIQALIIFALLASCCQNAIAGDEVDYSAPYLTLENGQLVTKYPAKEHVPGEEPVQATTEITEAVSSEGRPQWPIVAVTALVIISVLLLRRRNRAADS
jgi:hypothetical protein